MNKILKNLYSIKDINLTSNYQELPQKGLLGGTFFIEDWGVF